MAKKIKPKVSNALVSQIDFIASFADLLNIKLKNNEAPDSRNTLDAFLVKMKTGSNTHFKKQTEPLQSGKEIGNLSQAKKTPNSMTSEQTFQRKLT